MGIEGPEDIDKLWEEWDQRGALDTSGTEDGLLQLHEILRTCGADPEDPTSYRAILAVASILSSYVSLAWPLVMEELPRLSLRALRDLRDRGGA